MATTCAPLFGELELGMGLCLGPHSVYFDLRSRPGPHQLIYAWSEGGVLDSQALQSFVDQKGILDLGLGAAVPPARCPHAAGQATSW